ncbi:hypothetical protein [Desulfobotulus alkaliphilus]|nr:hypothetical protein [Desulfobotulus alkaliphilus]
MMEPGKTTLEYIKIFLRYVISASQDIDEAAIEKTLDAPSHAPFFRL